MYHIFENNINNNLDLQIYHDKIKNEYIPLANVSQFYGPDYGPRIGISSNTENIKSKDVLLQFYIGSIGILGIAVLYKFFEKS